MRFPFEFVLERLSFTVIIPNQAILLILICTQRMLYFIWDDRFFSNFKCDVFQPLIYKGVEFGVDLDTRVALVGPNGAGKSTLLKLIAGEVKSDFSFPCIS